jgi:threonine aldolase
VIRPHDDHCPRSRLIVVENTHNRGGGVVWPVESVRAIRAVAEHAGLRVHLDGARLMNACIASGVAPPEYTQFADTVSMCFSKGLGAPVGSILAGDEATIGRARRFRKMFGGTMRQAGLLAAGALYALDHHVERLAEDHAHARRLAEGLNGLSGLSCDPTGVQTNIVMVEVAPELGTAAEFEQRLCEAGVWTFSEGPSRIRAVTHLDVTGEQIEEAIQRVGVLCRG